MSSITSKITIPIKPTRIEKGLINELGELLENENLKLQYHLDSKSQEISSSSVQEFISLDWGKDIQGITISTGYCEDPYVKIEMNFNRSYSRECFISGKNATWVNGVANRIVEILEKYRLSYAPLKTNWLIKIFVPIILALILAYPIQLVFGLLTREGLTLAYLLVQFSAIGLYLFIQWLFPYFEYGKSIQKFMQKAIWFIIVGSGIGTSIVLRILGF